MESIFHTFTIKGISEKVFDGIASAKGLDNWWTKTSVANPEMNGIYALDFGPGFNWKAKVTKYVPASEFELQMTEADPEWMGTKIGFILKEKDLITLVEFYHTGWPEQSENYRFSSYCWAMYLRILKRYIEFGEQVAYEKRLSV
jgi:uncharacterized protein YndB with AHSA1/START domain